jgi:LemA protein
MWIFIGIGIVVLIALWGVSTYNRFVTLKGRVKNAWAQIEVNVKRRFDLIPNLVNTVKGYAAHESKTLEGVTEARTKYLSAGTPSDQMKANGELSGMLSKLFAVAEAYPDLKANANFIELSKELSKTEDKIAFARQFYNDTVMKFNIGIKQIPASIIAGIGGFTEEPYFEAEEGAHETPKVEF